MKTSFVLTFIVLCAVDVLSVNVGANITKSCKLPDGYVLVPGHGAYKLHTNLVTWDSARKSCVEEGAHLAIVDSPVELTIFQIYRSTNNLKSDSKGIWLGYHNQFELRQWITVLDEPFVAGKNVGWTPLIPNMPDNYGGNQHCARLIDGGLDDVECLGKYPYICEIAL
ncbi:hemolymph lipopolysaccharide-binding protein-like isoform X1 [Nasonia vitripennis]|uniref:C-type lectin domain-containing protein n=1 Tax=Nasonia vitripennis TaxID=7425 RepID=A0A7M7IUF4_NASVI|nr:hemolymph lipopolysaccharide-binding protein-like isoform X1 [Nasonia vitripennis]